MSLLPRLLKLFVIVNVVLVLTQCSTVPTETPTQSSHQLTSPFTMPATAYLALAKKQTGQEEQSLLLLAAGRMIYDGNWQQGLEILNTTQDLSPELTQEKKLLLAKIDLIRQRSRQAITKLAAVSDVSGLPVYYQAQYHEMLATAYQSIGNVAEAVSERMKLETLLPDDMSKSNNRRALWLSLTKLPLAELDTLTLEAKDGGSLKGWLELAFISRSNYSNSQTIFSQIERWKAQYPGHPGNYILPNPITAVTPYLFAPPKSMALLLPMTGPLAGPGNAIKDGFMAAYEASGSGHGAKVRVYNTEAADVSSLYQQALNDGADYIVGPLTKAQVSTVAALAHPVPTLLLNEVDTTTTNNAYQFGLSPGSEARQVAVRARKNGYSRVLVIAPAGPWGDDIINAFSGQWQASGGRVVDVLHYQPNDNMNAVVRDFLHITDSEAREKQLKNVIGDRIESISARRQDFDVIFLLAYPSKARQIMPLLKYYYAGNVPVYAISTVYASHIDRMKDKDLDGILFCDMPWVFTHQMGSRNWPEQYNSYNRLYALGMDSYALATQLNQLLLFPAVGVSDKSGVLYLSAPQQISRILVWGQFRQGAPQLVDVSN